MRFHPTLACALGASLVLGAGVARASSADDRRFLEKALKGDNSEIGLGVLAERKAADPAVRDFGRVLKRDHARAKREAMPVARLVGAPRTGAMSGEAVREYRRLIRLRGRAFDREFTRYMVEDHRKDVHDFREQADRGGGPVADLARRTLPTLEKHLQMAEQLAADRR